MPVRRRMVLDFTSYIEGNTDLWLNERFDFRNPRARLYIWGYIALERGPGLLPPLQILKMFHEELKRWIA